MARLERLAIKQHRPWRTVLVLAALLLVVGGGAAALYWRDVGRVVGALAESTAQRRSLEGRLEELEVENARLADALAILRRQAQVRRAAYAKVEADLAGQGERIAELQDEVRFYRGIFSQSLKEENVGVHGLKLWPRGGSGAWGYRLVLTHMGKGDKVIKGSMGLRLSGTVDGEPRFLNAAELGPGASSGFELRHFRELEGVVRLPEGFEAARVEVSVRVDGGDQPGVERSYDWSEVGGLNEEGSRVRK